MKLHLEDRMQESPAPRRDRSGGFTLIEILVVVAIILVLLGISIPAMDYMKKKAAISRTRAQIAAIEMALESYKADHGFYPRSYEARFSSNEWAQVSNSWLLCRALVEGPKQYYSPPPGQIQMRYAGTNVPNFVDGFGKTLIYYCSTNPTAPLKVIRPQAFGGQRNQTTFDLQSFGPDQRTFENDDLRNLNWYLYGPDSNAALDDITNWRN